MIQRLGGDPDQFNLGMLSKFFKLAESEILLPERGYGLKQVIHRTLLRSLVRVLGLGRIPGILPGGKELVVPVAG